MDGEIKKSRASLVGGLAAGFGVFVLTLLVLRDAGMAGALPVVASLLVGGVVATWIRIADL